MTANKGSWIIANLLPAISSGRTERPGPGAIGGISGASTRSRNGHAGRPTSLLGEVGSDVIISQGSVHRYRIRVYHLSWRLLNF